MSASETLVIIPARGGSKGLPRKNIRLLCGVPLIAYSIRSALLSESVNRVVVSTEDEEIAFIAREYGADVPFLRDPSLATDSASIQDTIRYTLDKLRAREEYEPDYVVALYPTSPFRTPKLIGELVGKLHAGYSPINTFKIIRPNATNPLLLGKDMQLVQVLEKSNDESVSLPFFRSYGLFWGAKVGYMGNPYHYLIKNEVELIDIDTELDYLQAEAVIRGKQYHFGW